MTVGKVAALGGAVLAVGGGYIGLNPLLAAELSETDDDDSVVVTDVVKDVMIADDVTAALMTVG